jgi:phosphoglycerol transferase MdoB-like AlkP superfamily enzyme
VFTIKVKRPQSTATRVWSAAQGVLSPIIMFTPIVLKLTGVIDWSWWWVLSPLWISGLLLVLVVLVVCALLVASRLHARRQARAWADMAGSEWFREFVAGKTSPRAAGGDLGSQDDGADR